MEIGEYVRTKDGYIYKIEDGEEFYEDYVDVGIGTIPDVYGIWVDKSHFKYVDKREIIKSSPNIIDLIQVGDYVNGCYTEGFIEKNKFQNKLIITEAGMIDNNDIKSIVTREMFESIEYKVKE